MSFLDTVSASVRVVGSTAMRAAGGAVAVVAVAAVVPPVYLWNRLTLRAEEPRTLLLHCDLLRRQVRTDAEWEALMVERLDAYAPRFSGMVQLWSSGVPFSQLLNMSFFPPGLVAVEKGNGSVVAAIIDAARESDPETLILLCCHPHPMVRAAAAVNPECPEHAAVMAALLS